MSNVISAVTARNQLGQILKRAEEEDERFWVERRGEPVVIIMQRILSSAVAARESRMSRKSLTPRPVSFSSIGQTAVPLWGLNGRAFNSNHAGGD